jgi:hypothetical protein
VCYLIFILFQRGDILVVYMSISDLEIDHRWSLVEGHLREERGHRNDVNAPKATCYSWGFDENAGGVLEAWVGFEKYANNKPTFVSCGIQGLQ